MGYDEESKTKLDSIEKKTFSQKHLRALDCSFTKFMIFLIPGALNGSNRNFTGFSYDLGHTGFVWLGENF